MLGKSSSSRFPLLHRRCTGANFLPVKERIRRPLVTAIAGWRAHMTLSEEMRNLSMPNFYTPFCGVGVSCRLSMVTPVRCVMMMMVSASPHFKTVDIARSLSTSCCFLIRCMRNRVKEVALKMDCHDWQCLRSAV